MIHWLKTLLAPPETIPSNLWLATLSTHSFLKALSAPERIQLKKLSEAFLDHKEFSGAHGLQVTDEMAVAIAAQACLPLLHMGKAGARLYDDFTGIVVHPGAMLARRSMTDAAGVVHHYTEVLAGESMSGGPVTLSWDDVATADNSADRGYNVVIHEFIHKIDMRNGTPNGCPPLPSRIAKAQWQQVMQTNFDRFKERVAMAERFGGEVPWLDAYGATAPAEFFAVASEAYFVNRQRFGHEFADLAALFNAFFRSELLLEAG
ncbi:MAG: zinc-dependent peptidase [Polaromonas sp.]